MRAKVIGLVISALSLAEPLVDRDGAGPAAHCCAVDCSAIKEKFKVLPDLLGRHRQAGAAVQQHALPARRQLGHDRATAASSG